MVFQFFHRLSLSKSKSLSLGLTSPIGITLGLMLAVLSLRALGGLESLELALSDQFFRWRSAEPIDDRIVIIGITEADVNANEQWPLSDRALEKLLAKLQEASPRAIGLNLYRNFNTPPGTAALQQRLIQMPTLIGTERLSDRSGNRVAPPPILAQAQRVGFDNVMLDGDRKVRRSFLYWRSIDSQYSQESFALKLAQLYLRSNQVFSSPARDRPSDLQLGRGVFRQFQPNTGNYIQADAGAYQVLVNFRSGDQPFQRFSMQDLLTNQVPKEALRDRIVLIGSMATSLQDYVATPHSYLASHHTNLISGVELQAHFISQIIHAAIDGRLLFQSWLDWQEILWIVLWTGGSVLLLWQLRSVKCRLAGVLGLSIAVLGVGCAAFLMGWIIPVVAPLGGLLGGAIAVTLLQAQSEDELKRSKEFLNRIINTIPDPIFVKDKQHHWVVLNDAYAKFVGSSVEELLGKSVHDVFPKAEADRLLIRDEETFLQAREREDEETITDLFGEIRHISTKRSLHRDAGGNVFLVGVIRDITARKAREAELEAATQRLSASNEALLQSQSRLHYLANHDALTDLPNRALFYEKLQTTIESAQLKAQTVAVLFIDLDGFKQVNDTLGHGIGDRLLQAVAKRLIACLRSSDTVSRLGGDEFTVILPGVPSLQDVERVAQKVIHTLTQPFNFDGNPVQISGSIGISLYPDCQTREELIEVADAAMYRAKQAGKNQYAIGTGNRA